jgi:hypothetical protein
VPNVVHDTDEGCSGVSRAGAADSTALHHVHQ